MDAKEQLEREAVVKEAMEWVSTPYRSNGDIKGRNGGVDCGMILLRVFGNCGLIEPIDPRPYPQQWPLNQSSEAYLKIIQTYAKEIDEKDKGPGDIVVFKMRNSLTYHHGGIIIDYPFIIHAIPPGPVIKVSVAQSSIMRRLTPKFFSIWPRS